MPIKLKKLNFIFCFKTNKIIKLNLLVVLLKANINYYRLKVYEENDNELSKIFGKEIQVVTLADINTTATTIL